jgi:hypothetical protein
MLVLLDIDGVMVPVKSWKAPELMEDGFPAFSTKAVHALQNLISDDTIVMLTTSHKSNYSLDKWKEMFKRRGLNVKNLDALPKNVNHISRKDEIITWAALNHLRKDFVIIDDDSSLNGLPQYLKQNLVLTSSLIGLTEENVKDVIQKKKLHFG